MKCFCVFVLSTILILTVFAPSITVYANQPNITAQAAIVMDFHTGEILYERDIHTPRPPASMTKTMTAFVVYEEIAAGRLTLDTMLPVSTNAARISNDPNIQGRPLRLTAGTNISVETLLLLMMPPSSNGAPVVVAEHISGSEEAFAALMNEHAEALGMFAEFTNSHGAINHYSTAYSMAVLIRAFVQRHPDILRIASTPYVMFEGVRHNSTNRFFTYEPFRGIDGMKTGTTREAGFCVSSTAYRDGRRIIAVNMNSNSNPNRYNDARALLNFGFTEAERRGLPISDPINIFINEVPLISEVPPIVKAGQILLPLRQTFEVNNFNVIWNEQNREVHLQPNNDAGVSLQYVVGVGGGALRRTDTFGDIYSTGIYIRNIGNRLFIPMEDYINRFMPGYMSAWDRDVNIVTIKPTQDI